MSGIRGKETGELLDCLFHHPRTKTASAHANTLGGAINHRADALKIRSEDSIGLIIGMADIMPGLMALATNLTYKSHDLLSFLTRFIVLKTKAMLP